jgi:hypothetical protein
MGKISWIGIVVFVCLAVPVFAQKKTAPNPIFTADSLTTGNYKDVLNSFFQMAFENLAGPDKEIKFTGTPFAVMAKMDTTLLVDTSYKHYKVLRRLNYAIGLKLDTAYRFNGFSSGIKYAIINKRDETVSNAFLDLVINAPVSDRLFALNNLISAQLSSITDPALQLQAMSEYTDFRKGKINFGDLNQATKDTILNVLKRNDSTNRLYGMLDGNKDFNMLKTADSIYKDFKKNFNQNLLWTVGVTDTTYKNQFVFSNIVFNSELVKGLNKFTKAKNELELNLRSQLQLVDDTLKTGRDLKRAVFNFEPGINLAFKTKYAKKSYLEIKFSGAYYHNFSSLYVNEERDRVIANATVRIRIFNDIWIAFEIKYDPKNGNLFGYINVRANFKALAGAAKQL